MLTSFLVMPQLRAYFIRTHLGIMQVMLRVTDLDKSIQYYTEALGLKLLRKKDNEQGRYTLAFLAYGEEQDDTVFELTYNW